jgi:preprotein translocase subunit SecG
VYTAIPPAPATLHHPNIAISTRKPNLMRVSLFFVFQVLPSFGNSKTSRVDRSENNNANNTNANNIHLPIHDSFNTNSHTDAYSKFIIIIIALIIIIMLEYESARLSASTMFNFTG